MSTTEIDISGVSFDDIDLTDSTAFVGAGAPRVVRLPRARTRRCGGTRRRTRPQPASHAGSGFWAVTSHAECTAVNRDYEHFSSSNARPPTSGTWPTTTSPSSS